MRNVIAGAIIAALLALWAAHVAESDAQADEMIRCANAHIKRGMDVEAAFARCE